MTPGSVSFDVDALDVQAGILSAMIMRIQKNERDAKVSIPSFASSTTLRNLVLSGALSRQIESDENLSIADEFWPDEPTLLHFRKLVYNCDKDRRH